MSLLVYGPYRISRRKATYDEQPRGSMRHKVTRRAVLCKAKTELADLEEYTKFMKRWRKLVEKGKVL